LTLTPSFGATLLDSANQQFDSSFSDSTVGPGLVTARIVPGDVRVGWITWEVPVASVAQTLQWKLNFGTNTSWDLTLPRQEPPASPGVVAPSTAFNTPVTVHAADDVPVTVTAAQVVDNATPEFGSPDEGQRYIAVQFQFTNTGSAAVSEFPDFDLTMIDTEGQQYVATFFDTDAGPGFGGQIDLAPGDTRTGFVAWQMPTAAQPAKVQVQLGTGTGDDIGELALA
jgi:hypothetical protein